MGGASEARFLEVLQEATHILEESRCRYLLIGGVAAAAALGQRWNANGADIDVLIHHEDRDLALRAFDEAGFSVSKHDPVWIYKAARPDVTVDLIWRSKGDIGVDDHMLARSVRRDFLGMKVRTPGDEDLLRIKAMADVEGTSHWRECLRMVSRMRIDWPYLVERSVGPVAQRVLSLLLYASSEGIPVSPEALESLWEAVEMPVRL